MNAFNIRRAQGNDAEQMAALDRVTGGNPWSSGRYRAICSDGANDGAMSLEGARSGEGRASTESALVSHQGAALLGFIVISCAADEGEIRNLAVAPANRRQGIGLGLVCAALLRMADVGCAHCYLEVRASNTGAQHLYAALGFSVQGERKGYYLTARGRENALLMALNIQDFKRRMQ